MDMERKLTRAGAALSVATGEPGETLIEGYASVFGVEDQSGDVVEPGACAASLARLKAAGGRVKMLWQHDPREPIGVWDEAFEDGRGLYVKGRILSEVERGRAAAALIRQGAIDGLSIGYRTLRSVKDAKGRRHLAEVDLLEVSLVTFPMLSAARVAAKDADSAALFDLAEAVAEARRRLTT